jgi:hypothetical protein
MGTITKECDYDSEQGPDEEEGDVLISAPLPSS